MSGFSESRYSRKFFLKTARSPLTFQETSFTARDYMFHVPRARIEDAKTGLYRLKLDSLFQLR